MGELKNNKRILFLILLITIYFSFFHGLGSVPLFDEDEGAFSEATREMVEGGNYITTYLNGKLRFDKPILTYWLQTISVKVFGVNEFAFRLPSSIAALLWAFIVFLFSRRFYNRWKTFLSVFFLVTALQVTIIAKAAIADALLNLFIAATMFCIYLFYYTNHKRYLRWAFLYTALGVLTKGPVAILIPVAVSFIFFFLKKDSSRWFRMVFYPTGLAVFLIVALPWYLLAYLEQGQAFIDGFFLKHNIHRFKTPFEGHAGSLVYYIPVVLAGVLPYTTLLLKGIRGSKTLCKNDLGIYCIIWFSFVFVFFSVSGTKLPHYVIYGYTPIFVLLPQFLETMKSRFLITLPALILVILLLFLPVIMPQATKYIHDEFAAIVIKDAREYITSTYWFIMIAAAAVLTACFSLPFINKEKGVVITGFLVMLLVNVYLMPLAGRIMQEPVKEAAAIARENNYDIVMWKINVYSFIVYTGKLVERRAPQNGEIVLTRANKLSRIKSYDILYQKNGVVLARVNEVSW